jgi:hypothetical protein
VTSLLLRVLTYSRLLGHLAAVHLLRLQLQLPARLLLAVDACLLTRSFRTQALVLALMLVLALLPAQQHLMQNGLWLWLHRA